MRSMRLELSNFIVASSEGVLSLLLVKGIVDSAFREAWPGLCGDELVMTTIMRVSSPLLHDPTQQDHGFMQSFFQQTTGKQETSVLCANPAFKQ
jgi:hypothetical protein